MGRPLDVAEFEEVHGPAQFDDGAHAGVKSAVQAVANDRVAVIV
jgi:hypothetical protein